jgi:hypothetical protein
MDTDSMQNKPRQERRLPDDRLGHLAASPGSWERACLHNKEPLHIEM